MVDTETALVTFACEVGAYPQLHRARLVGVAHGVALERLELIESTRGRIARVRLLIAFGLAYTVMMGCKEGHPEQNPTNTCMSTAPQTSTSTEHTHHGQPCPFP
jgi:hypothetical protein